MIFKKKTTESDKPCDKHLNCNMLREFLWHKDVSWQHTLKLEVYIAHLMHNLYQAGIDNQNSCLSINNLQAKMNELQTAYTAFEATQAQHESELQKKQLKHQLTQKSLTHKINSHVNT